MLCLVMQIRVVFASVLVLPAASANDDGATTKARATSPSTLFRTIESSGRVPGGGGACEDMVVLRGREPRSRLSLLIGTAHLLAPSP